MIRLKCLIENANKLESSSAYCFIVDSRVIDGNYPCLVGFIHELERLGSKHVNYKINEIKRRSYNFTYKQLDSAGRMFIYLNICPKFMHEWIQLYTNLLQNSSPGIIVQTLNRIMVTAIQRKDKTIEDIARKLLKWIEYKLYLKFDTVEQLSLLKENLSFNPLNASGNIYIVYDSKY